MLVEFVHVKTQNSQAISSVHLLSATFECGEEAHKLCSIVIKIFASKLHTFALKQLQVQLLDQLQMFDFWLQAGSQVHLDLHGLLDDLDISERELWSQERQASVDRLGQQVAKNVALHLGHGLLLHIFLLRCICKCQLQEERDVLENGFTILAYVLQLLVRDGFKYDVQHLPAW